MTGLAFWRRPAPQPAAYKPLLLDQASAQSLNRLAVERWDAPEPERAPRAQGRRVSPLRRLLHLGLPVVMLAFGALVTAGMVFGTIDALTHGGDVSWQDGLRIVIMAVLSLLFLLQLVAFLRKLPGFSHLAARLQGKPRPFQQPLLDQVSAGALMRQAPPDFGQAARHQLVAARGRRYLDAGSWVVLVAVAVGIAAFMGAGSALGAWSAFGQDGFGPAALLRLLFLAIAAVSLAFLVYFGLKGLRRQQQRRRGRLLRRLLYFLLRFVHSGRNMVSDAAGISNRVGDLALVRSGGSVFFPSGGSGLLATPAAIVQAGSSAPAAFAAASSATGGAGAEAGVSGAVTGGGVSPAGGAAGAQGGFVSPPGGGGGGPSIDGGGLVSPPGGSGGLDLPGGLVNPGGGGGGGFNFQGGLVNPGGGDGLVFHGGGFVTPPGSGGDGLVFHGGGFINPPGDGGSGGFALHGGFLAPFDGPGGDGQAYFVHPGAFDYGDGDPPTQPFFKPAVLTGGVLALAFLPFLFGGGDNGGGGGGPSPILGGGGIITIAPTSTPTPAPTETPTESPTETPTEAPTETSGDTQIPSAPQQPSATPPPASTSTPAPSSTPQPTQTPSPQPTLEPTATPTRTPPPTRTPTPITRPTRTPTPCSGVPGTPGCP
jgi:hypothetical protein